MGTHVENHNGGCGCRPVHPRPIQPISVDSEISPTKVSGEDTKYYREIGAEIIGNQLIIRVEKEKNKSSKRKSGQWDPPCDCDIPEIRMSSTTEVPKIINAGDDNQILFRIRSGTLVGNDDENGYKPEAFAYQLGAGNKVKDTNDQHRSITVHPNLTDPTGSQQIQSDHITDGNHNIYLLRIKKNNSSPSRRKRNIELEVRTPKPPSIPCRQPMNNQLSSRKSSVPKVPDPEIGEYQVGKINATERAVNQKKKKK